MSALPRLFGAKILKVKPELVPLVGFIGMACGMAAFYTGYSLYQKADVRVNKYAEAPAWERVDPEKQQKFMSIKHKYQAIPELEALRKEIGSYKY